MDSYGSHIRFASRQPPSARQRFLRLQKTSLSAGVLNLTKGKSRGPFYGPSLAAYLTPLRSFIFQNSRAPYGAGASSLAYLGRDQFPRELRIHRGDVDVC